MFALMSTSLKKVGIQIMMSAMFLVLVGAQVTHAQKKGGPGQCTRPSVPPPDSTCFSGSGCRDSSFNGIGYLITNLTPGYGSRILRVLAQPDGKIVGIGEGSRSHNSSTGTDLFIIRLNGDGSFDTTFGDINVNNPIERLGYTYIALDAGTDFIVDGALQPDGKILAGGWSAGGSVWHVVRVLQDGSLDSSFDGDGIRSNASGNGLAAIALQPDGKVVVGVGSNFNVTRLNSDGSVDTSFGVNGTATHNSSMGNGSSRLWSITFQRVAATPSEDRIVIGGWSNARNNGTTAFAIMRLRSNGTADSSFGTNAKVSTSFFGNGDQARSIAIDTSNRIVAGGLVRISSCSGTDFGAARYLENGQLDLAYGNQGKVSLDVYNNDNSPYGLAVQPDGKAIISGNSFVADSSGVRTFYATLVRFDSAGNPDATFGPGLAGPGAVTTRFSGSTGSCYVYTLSQQTDGNILAAGVADIRPVVVRYFQ